MCTPEDVVSGIVQAVGAAIEWREIAITKAEAEYKAESLMKEANIVKEKAGIERQEGIEEAREKRLQSILKMGAIKTNTAAGNISVFSQNTLNLLEDEKLNGELEALNILEDSQKSSNSYMNKYDKLYSQAQLQSNYAKDNLAYFKLFNKTSSNLFKTTKQGIDKQKSK